MDKLAALYFVGFVSGGFIPVPIRKSVRLRDFVESVSFVTQGVDAGKSIQTSAHFYGPIKLGGQEFNVLFDTGSTNVWVPGGQCYNCGLHPTYDRTKSSTYKRDGRKFHCMYGSGPVLGVLSIDTLTVGSISVQNQVFAEASEVSSVPFNQGRYDGIFGLGFQSASEFGIPSPFESMMNQKLIDEPVFAFFLDSTLESGELAFGGIDERRYRGKLVDVPLTSDSFWEFSLEAMKFGNTPVVTAAHKAIIDTGTSLFVGPTDMVIALVQQAGATPYAQNLHTINCSKVSTLPNIELKFGSQSLFLSPGDYIIEIPGMHDCLFAFMANDVPAPRGPLWIMGDVFMRKYYCVFDYGNKTIRLAEAATKKSPPGFIPVSPSEEEYNIEERILSILQSPYFFGTISGLFAAWGILSLLFSRVVLFKAKPLSTAHQVVLLVPFGLLAIFGTWMWFFDGDFKTAFEQDKIYGNYGPAIALSTSMLAFQIWDFCTTLAMSREVKGQLPHLVHHASSAVVCTIALLNGPHGLLIFYAPFFFGVSEISSIPLSLMDLFKYSKVLTDVFPKFYWGSLVIKGIFKMMRDGRSKREREARELLTSCDVEVQQSA